MQDKYHAPFAEGHFYHIFNRGNNKENIFFKQENYRYFLVKFDEYVSDFLEVYAFCLLPNHFHFLARLKENLAGFKNLQGLGSSNTRCPVAQAFSNLFNCYTKAINRQEDRTGSLLQKNFKRILIDKEEYLLHLVWYIHNNPVHHKICNRLDVYKWGSYNRILDDRPSKLMKKEVFELFGDKQQYIQFHQRDEIDFEGFGKYLMEE